MFRLTDILFLPLFVTERGNKFIFFEVAAI